MGRDSQGSSNLTPAFLINFPLIFLINFPFSTNFPCLLSSAAPEDQTNPAAGILHPCALQGTVGTSLCGNMNFSSHFQEELGAKMGFSNSVHGKEPPENRLERVEVTERLRQLLGNGSEVDLCLEEPDNSGNNGYCIN